jgi:hypothetical protein
MTDSIQDMAQRRDAGRAAIVAIMRTRIVTAEDVAHMRRQVLGDGCVTRDEAEALFALETSGAQKCAEWTTLFVEAITDHVVWEARPTGVVNESQGEWLISRCDTAASLNALAALVNILVEAHRVPQWFLAAVRARAVKGWVDVNVPELIAQSQRAA